MFHHFDTDTYSIIGLIGMIMIVIAYYLNLMGRLHIKQIRYSLMNLMGALLLLLSLCFHFNLGSFMIEIFWVAISLVGVLRSFRQSAQKPSGTSHPLVEAEA